MFNQIKLFFSFIKSFFVKKNTAIVEIVKAVEEKESITKVIFQPNTLSIENTIEYPTSNKNSQPIENMIEKGANEPPSLSKQTLRLECSNETVAHLDNLCRYFEISEAEAIARGLWLLTIVRDVEISDKKIGVITIDQNNLVTDLAPINLV